MWFCGGLVRERCVSVVLKKDYRMMRSIKCCIKVQERERGRMRPRASVSVRRGIAAEGSVWL